MTPAISIIPIGRHHKLWSREVYLFWRDLTQGVGQQSRDFLRRELDTNFIGVLPEAPGPINE